jgi:hypothetical protein
MKFEQYNNLGEVLAPNDEVGMGPDGEVLDIWSTGSRMVKYWPLEWMGQFWSGDAAGKVRNSYSLFTDIILTNSAIL